MYRSKTSINGFYQGAFCCLFHKGAVIKTQFDVGLVAVRNTTRKSYANKISAAGAFAQQSVGKREVATATIVLGNAGLSVNATASPAFANNCVEAGRASNQPDRADALAMEERCSFEALSLADMIVMISYHAPVNAPSFWIVFRVLVLTTIISMISPGIFSSQTPDWFSVWR